MADITWDSIVGDQTINSGGYVGDLLTLARAHVDAAIKNNELTKEAAGQVYTALIPAAIQNGIGFAMQEQLTEAKIAVEEDKLVTSATQRDLIVRQKEGFDDDAKNKLLKQQLDSWSVAYSVAKDANAIPDSIKVNPIDSTLKSAMDALGIVVSDNPIGEI